LKGKERGGGGGNNARPREKRGEAHPVKRRKKGKRRLSPLKGKKNPEKGDLSRKKKTDCSPRKEGKKGNKAAN